MAADNEILVLIYETLQKQLGQIKDSRVVIQSLANRAAESEKLLKNLDERAGGLEERVDALEQTLALLADKTNSGLTRTVDSNTALTSTVNAMRASIDNVTNPSIVAISNTHKDIKAAVRDLKNIHQELHDEFEGYQIRLLRAEDNFDKILKNQLLIQRGTEEKADEE